MVRGIIGGMAGEDDMMMIEGDLIDHPILMCIPRDGRTVAGLQTTTRCADEAESEWLWAMSTQACF